MTRLTRALALAGIGMILLPVTIGSQGQLNPKAVEFIKAADIKWVRNAAGTQETATLFGDPTKPGMWHVQRLRWLPGNMSRPHFHPNDRFFVVIEGTWWLGSGASRTIRIARWVCRPGTFVVHHAGEIHYDGAKDAPVVIQVMGMGPNTSTPAEKK